jgi:glutamine amidotransferase PdxT
MNAVMSLFRKNSEEAVCSSAKKNIKVFDSCTGKRIQISSDSNNRKMQIDYYSDWQGKLNIRIYGLSGYEVYKNNYAIQTGSNNFKIELNGLNEGMFIVETIIQSPREGTITTYNKIEIKSMNY